MILEYHRPPTIDDALKLIVRSEPLTLPLGGGTVLNAPHEEAYAVVDLQSLPLSSIELRGSTLSIGAISTLQSLLDYPDLQPAFKIAIHREATSNLRQIATVAGTLVASDARSPFTAALLALDAQLTLLPGDELCDLGNILQLRKSIGNSVSPLPIASLPPRLITHITFSIKPALAYEYVARTPADRPIVTVAAAKWPSGRLRVVVGGWGRTARLALDAPEPGGVEFAVRNITAEAGDQWASAEYRQDVAVTLAHRALKAIESQ